MKTLQLIFGCLFFANWTLYAQNPGSEASVLLNNVYGFIYLNNNGDEILAPPEGTFAEVFARPAGSNMEFAQARNLSGQAVFELSQPGFFDEGFSDGLKGFEPAQDGEFFVRAWRGASTWTEALNTQTAFIGKTPVFEDETGWIDKGTLDYRSSELDNMPSFTLEPVPEPSTVALGAIALFAVLTALQRGHSKT